MKKPWPLQQRARAEPRLPPSRDCNKASNTPPCQGNRKDHKESCDFHPNPATTGPLAPNMVSAEILIPWDTDGMPRPLPIFTAVMFLSPFLLRWHHERLVRGLHLCHLLLGMGRPPVPNHCQWKSNEELFPHQPGRHQRRWWKPGFPPLPSRKEELCHIPGVSAEAHRAIWVSTPTGEEQSNAILPLPVQCQRRPAKTGDSN